MVVGGAAAERDVDQAGTGSFTLVSRGCAATRAELHAWAVFSSDASAFSAAVRQLLA